MANYHIITKKGYFLNIIYTSYIYTNMYSWEKIFIRWSSKLPTVGCTDERIPSSFCRDGQVTKALKKAKKQLHGCISVNLRATLLPCFTRKKQWGINLWKDSTVTGAVPTKPLLGRVLPFSLIVDNSLHCTTVARQFFIGDFFVFVLLCIGRVPFLSFQNIYISPKHLLKTVSNLSATTSKNLLIASIKHRTNLKPSAFSLKQIPFQLWKEAEVRPGAESI